MTKTWNVNRTILIQQLQTFAALIPLSVPTFGWVCLGCLMRNMDNAGFATFNWLTLSLHVFATIQVYAIIIGDFALSDFQQDDFVTIMWFLVTFIGLVVIMNTLIAVITTSYDRSEKTSIILFRRARCEFVASTAAIQGFLRPGIFSGSRVQWKLEGGFIVASIARWVFIILFLVAVVFSSLYLIQGLIAAIKEAHVMAVIAMLFLCLVMVYTLWITFMFVVGLMLLPLCCGKSSRATLLLKAVNTFIVEKAAAQMFGVDVADTRGGEVIRLKNEEGNFSELFDRIDRLEKTLEKVLVQNATKEVDATDLDSTGSFLDQEFRQSITS
jgi:hypothetical protein